MNGSHPTDTGGAAPLAGRRVVVTRPRHQARDLIEAFEALGAEVVPFPTIRIVGPEDPGPLRRAIQRLDGYDWLVLTSRNGVRHFWRELEAAGLGAEDVHARVACVGRATAAEVEALGAHVDLVPDDQVGEGLLEALLGTGPMDGLRFLMPRAAVARDVLPDGLRQRGALVDDVECYRTIPDTEGAAAMRAEIDAGRIDALTFTSPSSVQNYVDVVGADTGGAAVVVIGPVTGDAARALGLAVAAEAQDHSMPGLVGAVVSLWQSGSR